MRKLSSSAPWTVRVIGGALALASGAATAELSQAAARATTFEDVAPPAVVEQVVEEEKDGEHVETPAQAPASPTLTTLPATGRADTVERATVATRSAAPTTTHAEPTTEPVEAPSRPHSADALSSNLRGGRIVTGATPHRLVLFTFDDGPDPRYTRDLLDALDEADVRALFFLTARRVAGSTPYERGLADIAREIVARGHYVGTHTMDHVQLPLVPSAALDEQVDASADALEQILGARPALLRPPGGSRSPRVDAHLAQRGYTQVLWNLGSGDFQVRTADEVLTTFRRVLEVRERDHGERGGIVLLHDIHAWGVEAFPRMVALLDRKNCELLERGEELYDFVDDPALFFEARVEGDAPSAAAGPLVLPPSVLAQRQIRARARAEARCSDPDTLDRVLAGRSR
jgi:peptidoglycan/xylan/chitin deacetylase (PgdA/CDA1 family)